MKDNIMQDELNLSPPALLLAASDCVIHPRSFAGCCR